MHPCKVFHSNRLLNCYVTVVNKPIFSRNIKTPVRNASLLSHGICFLYKIVWLYTVTLLRNMFLYKTFYLLYTLFPQRKLSFFLYLLAYNELSEQLYFCWKRFMGEWHLHIFLYCNKFMTVTWFIRVSL